MLYHNCITPLYFIDLYFYLYISCTALENIVVRRYINISMNYYYYLNKLRYAVDIHVLHIPNLLFGLTLGKPTSTLYEERFPLKSVWMGI